MNNCTFGALTAAVITGLLMSLVMPSSTPDQELIKANQALQDKLLSVADKSAKAYDEAAKALDDAKKNLSCPK